MKKERGTDTPFCTMQKYHAKPLIRCFKVVLCGLFYLVISKGKQDFLVTVDGKITFFELCLNAPYIYHTTLKYDKSNLPNILFFSDIKENYSNK